MISKGLIMIGIGVLGSILSLFLFIRLSRNLKKMDEKLLSKINESGLDNKQAEEGSRLDYHSPREESMENNMVPETEIMSPLNGKVDSTILLKDEEPDSNYHTNNQLQNREEQHLAPTHLDETVYIERNRVQ